MLDVGNVYGQAENILAAQRARDPNSPENQYRQLQVEQLRGKIGDEGVARELGKAKTAYQAFSEIAANPRRAAQLVPMLQQQGIVGGDYDVTQDNLMTVQQEATQLRDRYAQMLQMMAGPQKPVTVGPGAALVSAGGDVLHTQPFKPDTLSEEALKQKKELAEAGTEASAQAKVDAANRKREAETAAAQPGEQSKIAFGQEKTVMLNELIDEAKAGTNAWTAGLLGAPLSRISGTDSANLRATLDTIKANIGFDRLQEMRDASKTGGALGNVSERENELLQSVWGSLEQTQSPAQLRKNLERVRKAVKSAQKRLLARYKAVYGTGLKSEPTNAVQARDRELLLGFGAGGGVSPAETPEAPPPSVEDLVNKYAP